VAEWLHRWKPAAHVEDIRGILGQMLFSGEEGDKQTKALSGGEQARLAFCKLILTKPNILIFDEPTNHLDLEAINALNIALQRYEGTVLLVTHDHDLIDEVATRLWNFKEDGIEDFQGPYAEWKGKHNYRTIDKGCLAGAQIQPRHTSNKTGAAPPPNKHGARYLLRPRTRYSQRQSPQFWMAHRCHTTHEGTWKVSQHALYDTDRKNDSAPATLDR
jgi:energy-coupling factor transporter ATP-binding protein EcfA2